MSIALWCVLFAGLLPILCAGAAKSGASGFDNARPREWLANLEGWRKRMNAAQQNGWEAFPLFAAAVLVASTNGGPRGAVDLLALLWVAFRLAYVWAYAADRPTLRSGFFTLALLCAVTIFVSPAWD
ncbi:MAPEG family protein [Hansschlegelia zhihuaiae]|uniref:MAPEG family protein n=1 Tax=Hansschlegelia zhihuaiae TaxID=405005 RepID=A0A4Q0MJZ6_9HYPH|nr:MAPEG family protein [Hansschlegelia zhihuaiae]RXF73795.1 hypothetical protein EK403_09430 [Hansschlegelia zhihuaiae]